MSRRTSCATRVAAALAPTRVAAALALTLVGPACGGEAPAGSEGQAAVSEAAASGELETRFWDAIFTDLMLNDRLPDGAALDAEYAALCEAGHALACEAPSWTAHRGGEMPWPALGETFQAGCAAPTDAACVLAEWARVADSRYVAELSAEPPRAAVEALVAAAGAACEAGRHEACPIGPFVAWRAEGVEGVSEADLGALEAACRERGGVACVMALALATDARAPWFAPARARATLAEGCEAGHPDACASLGMALWSGALGEPEKRLALGHMERACPGGSYSACVFLAIPKAMVGLLDDAALLFNSCDRGHAMPCFVLATALYRDPKGDPLMTPAPPAGLWGRMGGEDYSPIDVIRTMCERTGIPEACDAAADTYRDQRSLEGDQQAIGLYRQACQDGNATACASLIDFVRDPADADVMLGLRIAERRCAAGLGEDCVRLQTLCERPLAWVCDAWTRAAPDLDVRSAD